MAVCIYVICDNAPYYRSKALQDYLKASRIQLVFLLVCAESEFDRAIMEIFYEIS